MKRDAQWSHFFLIFLKIQKYIFSIYFSIQFKALYFETKSIKKSPVCCVSSRLAFSLHIGLFFFRTLASRLSLGVLQLLLWKVLCITALEKTKWKVTLKSQNPLCYISNERPPFTWTISQTAAAKWKIWLYYLNCGQRCQKTRINDCKKALAV